MSAGVETTPYFRAADGETAPTMARAVRRADARRIEAEVTRGSRSNRGKRHGGRRPTVTIDAEGPQRTEVQRDVPTTDEGWKIVRSGYTSLGNDSLRALGLAGRGWSSSSGVFGLATTSNAYFLGFNAGELKLQDGLYYRWYGYPIRCLAY